MTTRLTLLVHGATDATRRAAFPSDEALDPLGRATLERLAPPRGDRALTSPAPAARETAAALGLEARIDDELRDLATGAWAGRTLADVAAEDPAGAAAFVSDPTFSGHGGEPIVALIARQKAWLAVRHGDRGRIVAVTHQAVVRAAITAALDAAPMTFWQIDVAPLGAVTLTSNGRRWVLRVGSTDLGA